MKFVYVLVSSTDDYYAEQAFLSVVSLKRHNPSACAVLVMDKNTRDNLNGLRGRVLEPFDELIVTLVPEELNKKCRSRYLKTSLRELITGSFLYIDCDTVITSNLESLESFDCDLAASYDCNSKGEGSGYMIDIFQKTGENDLAAYVFFNSGILLVKDTPNSRHFFDDWKSIWVNDFKKYGIEIDQISFLKANKKNGNFIKELPGEYNCQVSFTNSIDYLVKSKVIHYIAAYESQKEFPLENRELLQKIREEGLIEEVVKILDKPVENFLRYNTLLGKTEMSLYSSPAVVFARKLSRDFPFTNKIVRIIYRFFGFRI